MIVRTAKASNDSLTKVAGLVFQNEAYRKQAFPQCTTVMAVQAELKDTRRDWYLLTSSEPLALFTLHVSDKNAAIDNMVVVSSLDKRQLAQTLQDAVQHLRAESVIVRAPEPLADSLTNIGFEKRRDMIRLVGPVVETKLMPILALSSPSPKGIQILSKLMYEAYEKALEPKVSSIEDAERELRQIFSGAGGPYLAEASFMSGATHSIVSACLITLPSKVEARIAQLFTHPLYRARGLATTEVSTCMNKLALLGIERLSIWVGETNDVARRLFSKLGFEQENGKLGEVVLTKSHED